MFKKKYEVEIKVEFINETKVFLTPHRKSFFTKYGAERWIETHLASLGYPPGVWYTVRRNYIPS